MLILLIFLNIRIVDDTLNVEEKKIKYKRIVRITVDFHY
jgi:hypothetical protein